MEKTYIDFESLLKCIIKPEKTVFIGLGNIMKNDDKVGVYIIENLIQEYGTVLPNKVRLYNVGTSLENYLNKIIASSPNTIIFFDAIGTKVETDKKVIILSESNIQNYTFSTHNISLPTIIEYFELQMAGYVKPEIYIVGIKVNDISYGETLSCEVKKTADILIKQIKDWI